MVLKLIWWTVHDVDAAAICPISGDARRKVLVRVGKALIVLFLEFVLGRARVWIAVFPKGYDELVALPIRCEPIEVVTFFLGDDPAYVLVKPLLVDFWKAVVDRSLVHGSSRRSFLALSRIGRQTEAKK